MNRIELSKNGTKNRGKYFALVDDADYEWLNQWEWSANVCKSTVYARRIIYSKSKKVEIRMHRLILGIIGSKLHGDHKDHNGLNCQRNNLRKVTQKQNNKNKSKEYNCTSKYLGVVFRTFTKKWYSKRKLKWFISVSNGWVAGISINGIKSHIGYFKNEIDAAKAYDEAAKKYHGEFANLNFK